MPPVYVMPDASVPTVHCVQAEPLMVEPIGATVPSKPLSLIPSVGVGDGDGVGATSTAPV